MRTRFPATLTFAALLASAALMGQPGAAVANPDAASSTAAPSLAAQALQLTGRTALPNYSGDFDHFAVDLNGNRLFLAGEDQGTLEVFDLRSGSHLRTIKGLEQPHAILYLPEANRLIVTDSGKGMTKVLDARTYQIVGNIELTPGADSMRYDPSRKRMYVVTGGKNADPKMAETVVSEVDPIARKRIGDMKFDTDFTEAMAVEQHGKRLYVNLTGKSVVAVIDKDTRTVIDTWPIKGAELNAPLAFDESNHRLFVVTRKPFRLLVLNADTGEQIASFDAPQRTNEIMFDKANARIYLAGDDYIGVFQQLDADHYEELGHVPTAKGAKTAIFVPERHLLYAAVSPGDGGGGGALLRFDVRSAKRASTTTAK